MLPPVKLPSELDNPIDSFLYSLLPPVSEWAHRNCLTPNHITTVSLLGGLLAIYGLKSRRPLVFVIGYVIAYVGDALDGYVARKYDQCTEFGDYYDHVKDTLVHIVLFVCLYQLAVQKNARWVVGVLLTFMLVALWHLKLMDDFHCEQHPDSAPSRTIHVIQRVMPECLTSGGVVNGLLRTRFLGLGTFAVALLVGGAWLASKKE